MKSQEKQKIIDQSLVACHVNAEAPRDRGEVKLYELSKVQVLEFLYCIKEMYSKRSRNTSNSA